MSKKAPVTNNATGSSRASTGSMFTRFNARHTTGEIPLPPEVPTRDTLDQTQRRSSVSISPSKSMVVGAQVLPKKPVSAPRKAPTPPPRHRPKSLSAAPTTQNGSFSNHALPLPPQHDVETPVEVDPIPQWTPEEENQRRQTGRARLHTLLTENTPKSRNAEDVDAFIAQLQDFLQGDHDTLNEFSHALRQYLLGRTGLQTLRTQFTAWANAETSQPGVTRMDSERTKLLDRQWSAALQIFSRVMDSDIEIPGVPHPLSPAEDEAQSRFLKALNTAPVNLDGIKASWREKSVAPGGCATVRRLIERLEAAEAECKQGIFRVPGDNGCCATIQRCLEAETIPSRDGRKTIGAHDLATVLKRAGDGLLPIEVAEAITKGAPKNQDDVHKILGEAGIHPEHIETIDVVFRYLVEVLAQADTNKMTLANLGMVMCNLPAEPDEPASGLEARALEMSQRSALIKILIAAYQR